MAFTCVICGKNAGLTANKLANGNGYLCKNCLKAVGGLGSWMQLRTMSIGEIRERVGASSPELRQLLRIIMLRSVLLCQRVLEIIFRLMKTIKR